MNLKNNKTIERIKEAFPKYTLKEEFTRGGIIWIKKEEPYQKLIEF